MRDQRIPVELDYLKVRTVEDLQRWAIRAFSLSNRDLQPEKQFLMALYLNLQERGSLGRYAVKERWKLFRSNDVRAVLEGMSGWKQALGFHLDREGTGASVLFK